MRQLERSIEVSRETLIVGIVGRGVCFPNGYFQLSLRDFVIVIVSRETIPVTRQKFIEHREITFDFPT